MILLDRQTEHRQTDLTNMQALILAGGFGTRLRPLTLNTPKPALSLVNRPILSYQLELIKRAGITDVILSLNYQPDKIQEAMGDGSAYGVKITYVVEPMPLGTAGAVGYARDLIDRPTVILNGDNLINLDLSAVINAHKTRNAAATIVLQTLENPVGYGLVAVDDDLRVLNFLEKPSLEDLSTIKTRTVNAGTYILEPDVLNLIPQDEVFSFEYGVFPKMLERGDRFFGFPDDSYWLDVGNPERYLQAHQDLINGRVSGFGGKKDSRSLQLAEDAFVCPVSVFGDDCLVGNGVRIENSVIGNSVTIENGAIIVDSVIHNGTKIGSEATITGAIIGRDCFIGPKSRVSRGNVLGDRCILTEYSQV